MGQHAAAAGARLLQRVQPAGRRPVPLHVVAHGLVARAAAAQQRDQRRPGRALGAARRRAPAAQPAPRAALALRAAGGEPGLDGALPLHLHVGLLAPAHAAAAAAAAPAAAAGLPRRAPAPPGQRHPPLRAQRRRQPAPVRGAGARLRAPVLRARLPPAALRVVGPLPPGARAGHAARACRVPPAAGALTPPHCISHASPSERFYGTISSEFLSSHECLGEAFLSDALTCTTSWCRIRDSQTADYAPFTLAALLINFR